MVFQGLDIPHIVQDVANVTCGIRKTTGISSAKGL